MAAAGADFCVTSSRIPAVEAERHNPCTAYGDRWLPCSAYADRWLPFSKSCAAGAASSAAASADRDRRCCLDATSTLSITNELASSRKCQPLPRKILLSESKKEPTLIVEFLSKRHLAIGKERKGKERKV